MNYLGRIQEKRSIYAYKAKLEFLHDTNKWVWTFWQKNLSFLDFDVKKIKSQVSLMTYDDFLQDCVKNFV